MRYLRYLMIPSAFFAGLFAVNSVQAQMAYVEPSYYSKTGYAPVPAGSFVSYSADGQAYDMQADLGSFYVKSGQIEPMAGAMNYAPALQYLQPQAGSGAGYATAVQTMPSGRTFVRPDGTFVNADGQQVYYVMGQPQVVVYRDTSDLPGYGIPSPAPTSAKARPYDAQDFPAVYATPGTASYYLENAYPSGS